MELSVVESSGVIKNEKLSKINLYPSTKLGYSSRKLHTDKKFLFKRKKWFELFKVWNRVRIAENAIYKNSHMWSGLNIIDNITSKICSIVLQFSMVEMRKCERVREFE